MNNKLFMLMLGCCPPGRHTEQHDIFFSVGTSLKELVPGIIKFWPEANGRIHVDAWREVNYVGGYKIEVVEKGSNEQTGNTDAKLFFINLGGYQRGLFDEPHKKLVTVQPNMSKAIAWAKETEFFKTVHFEGANSHIDDKFGVDVDDIYEIEDILPAWEKQRFTLRITPTEEQAEDEIHLGYFKLANL
ncbi:DUF1543 domain-containing protein [Mucilaginibacter ginkgonis]|uniref:DUF1543 domain-containing protein n=1 Tax=Mucilaginibacter ginkgonis TaxID=2682091 RepID=A0A6I4HXG6_9SPHI|nr:DUF1543 domain-containing protein [Mucilaginibacter ginkgonis]QQL51404.1 DUF1543 domain-containing protein [Mucilaginibacter ginkgonis]